MISEGDEKKQQERARRIHELLNKGARLLYQRRPGEAVLALEEAYTLDPENVDVAINLGGAYVMQGRFSKAIPVLEAASQRAPNNSMVWTNLAAAYLGRLELSSREMQDRAIAAFERALQANPGAPNVHYNLGLIYKERGDLKRAFAHFQRALETDPNDRDARFWLDWIQRAGEPGDEQQDPPAEEPDEPEGRFL
ncbi:MAG: tetratricopeptide repeat protein [Anaerolineae bacterium]|nr:tetratricopeptide repeat protein [Anaerolineae bacterium]MDW8099114.1 tetratricopeptide repeat protein [Anaerolineae bacterium]